MNEMSFPIIRMRRLRTSHNMRRLVQETRLSVDSFIYPLFLVHGRGVEEEMPSLPGVHHLSLDLLPERVMSLATLGIPGVLLFGLPAVKDEMGSEAWDAQGIVQEGIRVIKETVPELVVATDICLCQYTSHGHCGIVEDGRIDNDETLEVLVRVAVSHAEAGADLMAPSDMMDGRVMAIRDGLDEEGLEEVAIMAYSAKFASSFYGPFRDAAHSAPQFGDRRSYQMPFGNLREAIREIDLDVGEGADIVMVKPALPYLDVIARVRDAFALPLAAYSVSGEYAMIKAAARAGWLDERAVALEALTAIKRAGADIIITYFAPDAARWLREE